LGGGLKGGRLSSSAVVSGMNQRKGAKTRRACTAWVSTTEIWETRSACTALFLGRLHEVACATRGWINAKVQRRVGLYDVACRTVVLGVGGVCCYHGLHGMHGFLYEAEQVERLTRRGLLGVLGGGLFKVACAL